MREKKLPHYFKPAALGSEKKDASSMTAEELESLMGEIYPDEPKKSMDYYKDYMKPSDMGLRLLREPPKLTDSAYSDDLYPIDDVKFNNAITDAQWNNIVDPYMRYLNDMIFHLMPNMSTSSTPETIAHVIELHRVLGLTAMKILQFYNPEEVDPAYDYVYYFLFYTARGMTIDIPSMAYLDHTSIFSVNYSEIHQAAVKAVTLKHEK